ncbi:MAG TPA: hypothetical protein IAC60_00325 [Candidatus Enterosoma merdigallinarum]|nr:hypothetical protein [Candidatus Enterosoma merdigallinarum]
MVETVDYILFCVETTAKCQSDKIYLVEYLRRFFDTRSPRYDFLFLGGKSNYDDSGVLKRIERNIQKLNKGLKKGESRPYKIIYCIDLDGTDNERIMLNNTIKTFCIKKKFDLIWFYKDIESVFWGKSVIKNKGIEAERWVTTKKRLSEESILDDDQFSYHDGHSNLKTVLSLYFAPKV